MIDMLLQAGTTLAEARFPQPEFETGYQYPTTNHPLPWIISSGYLPLFVLIAALCASAYLLLKKRSRKGVFGVMLLSLAFFGFYQKGCICVVGSTQNVGLALFDSGYQIPFSLALFFIAPLFFTLFFGRVFCGSVCPLGAIQDVVMLKPLKLPSWADHVFGMIPYSYLALAVLLVANNACFLICEYDPFVAVFRLHGTVMAVLISIVFLLLCVFVGRAYCRFVCPYGALLRLAAFFSKHRVSITPDECIKCKLCENACPFGAINKPFPEKLPETRDAGKKRIAHILLATPIVILLTGFCLSRLDGTMARFHPTVRLAEQMLSEDLGTVAAGETLESLAFRASQTPSNELYAEALAIQKSFRFGGWLLGFFIAIVVQGKLLSLSTIKRSDIYEADRMKCLSCGRCYKFCPVTDPQ